MLKEGTNKSFSKPKPVLWLGDGSRGHITRIEINEKGLADVYWIPHKKLKGIKRLFYKPKQEDVLCVKNIPYSLIVYKDWGDTIVINTSPSGRSYCRLEYLSLDNPDHLKFQKALLECKKQIDIANANLIFIIDRGRFLMKSKKLGEYADKLNQVTKTLKQLDFEIKNYEIKLKDIPLG